jgi:SAM-dependent methyltransferase
MRYLKSTGRYLLDAGSGPIQYPEYLEYSKGYQYRVCADISSVALQEARQRIEDHGLFVVADVTSLPFKPGVFGSMVSLHTIHHLPEEEHMQAYREIYRTLAVGSTATVVNGWPSSSLMRFFRPMMRWSNRVRNLKNHLFGRPSASKKSEIATPTLEYDTPKGTFTDRHDVAWVKEEVGGCIPVEILVWRSISVRFMRTLIHPWLGGRFLLRLLFWLEDLYPHYFGENGQYPLILISKPPKSVDLSNSTMQRYSGRLNQTRG